MTVTVAATPTPTSTQPPEDGPGETVPGFGVLSAVVGTAGALAAMARRRVGGEEET